MKRLSRLARNSRLLFWARAFTELKMLNAIIALFYLARGITVEEIFYLTVVYSVGTLLFEIPSGYLADRFGRKPLLMFGVVAVIASLVISFFAYGFFELALTLLLLSLAESCFSGTAQALVYDSLKELGREKEMAGEFARIESARHFIKIFAPTLGAVIASQLLPWQFTLLIAINCLFAMGAFILLAYLEEPEHRRSLEKTESLAYIETLRVAFSTPFLLRATMNSTLIFVAAVIAWRSYQPLLESFGLSVTLLGLFYFLMHALTFAGKWYTKALLERVRIGVLLRVSAMILVLLSIVSAFSKSVPVLFISMLLLIIFCDIRAPWFSEAVNRHIASHHRATTLSNLALIKALIDIPLLLLAARLSTFNIQYPLFIVLGLVIVAVTLFRIKTAEMD